MLYDPSPCLLHVYPELWYLGGKQLQAADAMTALLKLNYAEIREALGSPREFRSVHPKSNCILHRKRHSS